jgi:hypothetical protein
MSKTEIFYEAANKALCELAFSLQEVREKRRQESEEEHAPRKTEEEETQRRQHLCYNGKPVSGVSNGGAVEVSRKRPHSSLRAAVIFIPVREQNRK